jgi:cyanophycinase
MFVSVRRVSVAVIATTVALAVPAFAQPRVGPAKGTVVVVGGGSMGPEIYSRFIQAAGGPDALIIDVPTAGGDTVYTQDAPGTRGWKLAGAKNVYVLHTKDRKLADSDSFAAIVAKAGGVWFEGGRQFHLWDSYGGTKTEKAFHDVLARGGVVGGSSAGASILGSFMVRGAPSNDNFIMYYPGYEKAFGFLRNTGVDQHVVARERLPDLADSIIPRFPDLLGISEDEGTAWFIRGDTGTIVGRNKAFVYGKNVQNDGGKPFLTLHPGDRYDLAARRVIRRAVEDGPVAVAFVDDLFKKYSDASAGGATVLVAQNGNVYIDKSYGIGPQPKYMPTTTVPQFNVGGITEVFNAICSQLPEQPARGGGRAAPATPDTAAGRGRAGRGGGRGQPPGTPFQTCVTARVRQPLGAYKTNATPEGQVLSNVDELYRLSLGLENPRTYTRDTSPLQPGQTPNTIDYTRGWTSDTYKGVTRFSAWGTADGKKAAFVRIPDKKATIIVLTNDDSFDAKSVVDKISERLLR